MRSIKMTRPVSLAFSPDGRWLAVGTGSGVVEIRDVTSLALLGHFRRNQIESGLHQIQMVSGLHFLKDGGLLTSSASPPLRLDPLPDLSALPDPTRQLKAALEKFQLKMVGLSLEPDEPESR